MQRYSTRVCEPLEVLCVVAQGTSESFHVIFQATNPTPPDSFDRIMKIGPINQARPYFFLPL